MKTKNFLSCSDLSAHHGHKVLPSILTNRRVLPAETTKEILIHLEIGPNPETGEPAPYYEPGDHLVSSKWRHICLHLFDPADYPFKFQNLYAIKQNHKLKSFLFLLLLKSLISFWFFMFRLFLPSIPIRMWILCSSIWPVFQRIRRDQ